MQLDQLIGKLLLHNNCVVVPDFGGFVASRVSARIDYEKGSIQPPHKAVLFNKQLVNNDGLLVHAFAHESSISFEEATLLIAKQVKSWQEDLNAGKRIQLEQVGYLFLNGEKNLCFEQDRFHNLLLSSFGMSAVQFIAEKEIAAEKIPVVETKIVVEAPIISLRPAERVKSTQTKTAAAQKEPAPIRHISSKKVIRYVAAACLLPLGFYSFWLPMKTDVLESGLVSTQDFNPFHKKNQAQYATGKKLDLLASEKADLTLEEQLAQLPESVSTYSFDLFENGSYIHIQLSEPNHNTNTEATEISLTESNIAAQNYASIQVLAGSFSNEDNANQLKNELIALGFDAFTTEQSSGLTRVSAGKFGSIDAAQDAVNKLAGAGKSAWILK